ncbi:MAG: hypothetical protein AAF649_07955 [Verrucomicrobiota bacterium]
MISSEFASFNLAIPENPALHLVASQKRPLRYENGRYLQNEIWIVQPKVAGLLRIEGIRAIVNRPTGEKAVALPAIELTVRSYGSVEDNFAPAPLPEVGEFIYTKASLSLAIALALMVMGILTACLIKRNKDEPDEIRPTTAALARLKAALTTDDIPVALIESTLNDASRTLSPELREALEHLAYSRSSNAKRVLELLDQEVRP